MTYLGAHTAIYALDEKWTRGTIDRLIVAQARARSESVLVSRDAAILKNYSKAVW
ncbi:MAG: hypothetical protein K2Q23_18030 [Bryobacteraceae bacterium]|nr:hypothetical protein [Bryobacteraceae bacterium]